MLMEKLQIQNLKMVNLNDILSNNFAQKKHNCIHLCINLAYND